MTIILYLYFNEQMLLLIIWRKRHKTKAQGQALGLASKPGFVVLGAGTVSINGIRLIE